MAIGDLPCFSRASNKKDELMQVRIYIESNGDVTITVLVGGLVPVAFSLDKTDQQMQRWLDTLSGTDERTPERRETTDDRISTRRPMEG